ncbi:MAG TPA: hypothetical protein VEP90_18105 [Methylomirabilota bacterium]|nr:hypothetical protein [Methylomirabilota bacterium]
MIANGTSYTDVNGTWTYNGALQRWEVDGTPIFITGSANNAVTANGSTIIVGNSSVNASMSSNSFSLNGVSIISSIGNTVSSGFSPINHALFGGI